jgi:hypothetical protein
VIRTGDEQLVSATGPDLPRTFYLRKWKVIG